ncbi:ankyrin repeat domain containing protein, putative [Babesia bigemina]|uniref:Ankyrin repeat domain containing protein, putative n=1 Tax=Babesia bigemina TaxID=5866 RepID=A0A061DE77_BABBI|nr:ankyrin repeat domain containing protein, putative [Babesia bigemina]CDR98044.1 ankyrin repeat domain containing protein, putative [Babesia bigemina]|eukprot:XP_012770230.1 ankyrin repeat domain containing protein, putative [Babesia bigemina]
MVKAKHGSNPPTGVDVEGVLRDFADRKLSEERGCTVESLQKRRAEAFKNAAEDERLYKVFASCFMERRMWREALTELHTRLYLLDKESKEYEATMDMIRVAQHNLLAEVMPIPVAFKELLFVRDLEEKWSTWMSQVGYTEQLTNVTRAENAMEYRSNTLVTRVNLKPGSLLMRKRPFAAAPWCSDTADWQSSTDADARRISCFHCLSVMRHVTDPDYQSMTFVSCPLRPFECLKVFCSEDCFLHNGAVHAAECEHLMKLKSFATTALNETFVMLTARTLIRCGLCAGKRNSESSRPASGAPTDARGDVLQQILDVKVDYATLEQRYLHILDKLQMFADFLLKEMGVKFCLYLTRRELVHMMVVLWTKSVSLKPDVYSDDENVIIGGVVFDADMMCFQQSRLPTLVAHLDGVGRVSIRSIYTMEPGMKLFISTAMDKYVPFFIQDSEFWSAGLLLSEAVENCLPKKSPDISAVRCGQCIRGFCHIDALKSPVDGQADERSPKEYSWACSNRCATNDEDLNQIENRAESIIMRAHRLYVVGQHLVVRKLLDNFVWRWSGALHPKHYLLYNAHVLLAGIKMNKAGSNALEAVRHLTAATIMAEEMLPLVCHEKAHLYSRLADLMGQLVMTARVNRKEDVQLKQMTLEAAYTALWNWTVIAGAESREALIHMQKCRNIAFQMNVHVSKLCNNFVIHVPGKYMEIFKQVTGNCVLPPVFRFSAAGDLSETTTDHVATIAFMAAQSEILNEEVLEMLMSMASYGIMHLGTGLSVLGIAASNGSVEMVKAITESIHTRIDKAYDFISKNGSTSSVESTIANLLLTLAGGNELGVTPLIAMVSMPTASDPQSLKNEIIICRLIVECAEKCDEIIERHRGAVAVQLRSLRWLMESKCTVKSLVLDARTHNFLQGQTLLHYAAARGKRNLVQYLARLSGNVNQMNLEGATPLHLAAMGAHIEVCETLLSFGAKQNVAMNTGELPIHLAVHALHEDTVKLLQEQHAKNNGNMDAASNSACLGRRRKRGPSIWHALVSGIYRPEASAKMAGDIRLDVMVSRLERAARIAQFLAEHTPPQEMYVWSDMTPSQLLRQKWEEYTEGNSHLFDAQEGAPILHKADVDAYQPATTPCSVYNEGTDTIFVAERAMQFLAQLLKRAEEGSAEAANQRTDNGAPPTPANGS